MNEVSNLVSRWHVGRIHPTPDVEPEGWTLEKLCDIARLESGHTPSRNRPDYWDGNIPWLSLHDSKTIEGKTLYNTKMTVSALGLANSSARLLPAGTVALSRTATIGKVAVLGREMATSQDFACYVCGPRLSNAYLAHLFRGMEVEWDRLMAGSTHNTIYMPIFENMQILVPPMEEQEAIAEALSDADALIEGLERLIAKKRLIKQGAMQDLLTAKRRLPGFSGEWVERKLGDLCKVARGASPRPIASTRWFDNSSSVGWVRISDLPVSGRFLKKTTQRLSPNGIARSRRVPIGSLIMSIAATVGRPAVTAIDTCIHDGFVVFSDLQIDQLFLFYLLKTMEPGWSLHGQTGSQMNINTTIIELAEVKIPAGIDEQNAIAEVFADMDAEIQTLETRLEKARQVKEGMMQNLLTGRIRLV
ncbi:MAG: restriction endonuclease subunit S [Parvularcula sp.]|nr:restriction endonuclease subunit S [Parvularcula sp.]